SIPLARIITKTSVTIPPSALAAATPSAPLLPLPQTTQTDLNLKCDTQNWDTAYPVRCMRANADMLGRPIAFCTAWRTSSEARILIVQVFFHYGNSCCCQAQIQHEYSFEPRLGRYLRSFRVTGKTSCS